MEFHDNIICRMEAGDSTVMGDGQLKHELAQRRTFKEMMGEFIQ